MSTMPDLLSVDEFLAMPDGDDFELVAGQLVERKLSVESSWIAGKIYRCLGPAEDSGVDWIFPEGTGFRCFLETDKVRRPDAALVHRFRMPQGLPTRGFVPVAPDLAVEVVSPHDTAYEIDVKIEEWLDAGASEVWRVMLPTRTVTIYRRGVQPQLLHGADRITTPLIPGFDCPVETFFPMPPSDAAPAP